jgi:hypothetical protein
MVWALGPDLLRFCRVWRILCGWSLVIVLGGGFVVVVAVFCCYCCDLYCVSHLLNFGADSCCLTPGRRRVLQHRHGARGRPVPIGVPSRPRSDLLEGRQVCMPVPPRAVAGRLPTPQ